MRKLAALVLLFSAQAFACPDLTGSFQCQYQDGSTETVSITQANKSGVMVYNYNGTEIPADRITYDVPDEENIREGKFTAWCDDDVTLKANLNGKYWSQGNYIGDLTMDMFFSIENGNLKTTSNGVLKTGNGDYPVDSNVVCTRN